MQSSFLREMAEERAQELAEEMAETMARTNPAEGRAEGLRATRLVCAAMVKMYHLRLAPRALPEVERCTDLKRLTACSLRAPLTSDNEFCRLLGLTPKRRTTARAKAAPDLAQDRVQRSLRPGSVWSRPAPAIREGREDGPLGVRSGSWA